ncbi:MAG: HNH endonuclease [Desulfobacterota bacterium]|nr:HNH endonuclease [Thermodesulfobacteriota bacterium]
MVKRSNHKLKRACVYCGSTENLTIDHVVPISCWKQYRIKRRVLDNKSNRVIACQKCNQEKGKMDPKVWFEKNPHYRERFLREAKYLSDTVKKIAGLI